MDHDIYSAHDAIGRVYIILNPLVESGSPHSGLEGWFPIFDTLHGVRGEVYVQVKVELIQDQHRFKQSSFGVQFYCCTGEPEGMAIHSIHGFVEELVVNDDPEYQWIDRLRTPRASNEARQRLFSKLSGELRRKISARALEVDANAILGYKQSFDIEGESGVVVRGIGTCVGLVPKPPNLHGSIPVCFPATVEGLRPVSTQADGLSDEGAQFDPVNPQTLTSPQHSHSTMPSRVSMPNVEGLPASPSTANVPLTVTGSAAAILSTTPPPPPPFKFITAISEYPFFTLASLPSGVLGHIGGLVTARSVKLLDKINNPDDPETRDAWWREIRVEMKAHLKAMGCSVIMGYCENTSICDTLCVFSATGTAVTVNQQAKRVPTSPGSITDVGVDMETEGQSSSHTGSPARSSTYWPCSVCHLPYSTNKLPFDIKATFCRVCRRRQVPGVLLSTTALPAGVEVRGRGCMVQTRVCFSKKKMKGEENAFKVSKELPFLEYALHNRLLNKLYVCGMNAVFGLKIQVSVGDTVMTGVATGTAVYLESLPSPPVLSFPSKEESQSTAGAGGVIDSIQATMDRQLQRNRRVYGLTNTSLDVQTGEGGSEIAVATDEDTPTDPDLTAGKKDVFLVDISDVKKDRGMIHSIVDRSLPDGFHLSNLSSVPGVVTSPYDSKMVTIIKKMVFSEQQSLVDTKFSNFLDNMIQALVFKVRNHSPCVLSDMKFDVDLPEEDEVQVSVTTMVSKTEQGRSEVDTMDTKQAASDECIFSMDESKVHDERSENADSSPQHLGRRKVVLMSSASSVAGWCVAQHIGMVNIFLIRESTSIRESGGLGVFMDVFLLEANAIARAHVKSMGGNAILTYQLNKCVIIDHPHKNQAQSLINISGDAVKLNMTSQSSADVEPV
jgi:hypothetical protein